MLNGIRLEFEGTPADCGDFAERFIGTAAEVTFGPPARDVPRRSGQIGAIGVREMRTVFKRAEPRNDAERVGVIVAVAHEHKQTPVDISFIREWFKRLGLREPAAMRATVSNARKSGLVTAVAYGQIATTERGLTLVRETPGNVVQMPRRARMK